MNFAMMGGPMIGPHITAQKVQFGPILNNLVVWDVYAPEPTLQFPGTKELIERYQPIAQREGTDALGHYVPPLAYAQMQVVEQSVRRVGRLDQAAIAADMRSQEFDTVIGRIKFDGMGEWTEERNLYTQYQGVRPNDVEQFRRPGTQVVLYPERFRSGTLRAPYRAGAEG